MTEEEFMKCVERYHGNAPWDRDLAQWSHWLSQNENDDLFELVIRRPRIDLEEIRTAWHVRNSPLVKALK